ncbi:hypothetical protein OGATHE_005541 [Ogataea polymorpha]|uniref:Uncharacterized protein n=1 Tax=Ogataea polymorpha TaxID=460523 RepID=A0A9P8SZG0_9ASCO|nr:hypothetical protein OGATHE_005541 [Ogataea polymorpha]
MYLRYSVTVVAPIQWKSPLARAGFSRLAASDFPSPINMWISSMNRMTMAWDFSMSLKTPLSLSSNSPWYFAPAFKAPKSSEYSLQPCKTVGTSLSTILCATPSTILVLPTPGSPIRHGFDLALLANTRIVRLISSSLPMTGSILPCSALSVKSMAYLDKNSNCCDESACLESILWFPLNS